MALIESFTIRRPADMHAHFRDGDILKAVVPATAKHFDIAVAMPNLVPPITWPNQAKEYCERIRAAAKDVNPDFQPLGIAYLTDDIDIAAIRSGFSDYPDWHHWHAAKLYPANATTNSAAGVTSLEKIFPVLAVMEEIGMPLLLHGEVVERNGVEYAPWDREHAFVEGVLPGILKRFPALKVVLEHISTKVAVDFVIDGPDNLAATITPHHLTATAADMARGGWNVHGYCMPILKTASDRTALRQAAILPNRTNGKPMFFAGTDTAPHLVGRKHSSCCPGGAFVAPGALEAYASVFVDEGMFEHPLDAMVFEEFMSTNGPSFYGIPHAKRSITLTRNTRNSSVAERFFVPSEKVGAGAEEILPFYHQDSAFAIGFPYAVKEYA